MTGLHFKEDNQSPVSRLAKACFVSLGLLLIGSAAQAQVCQNFSRSVERIGTEFDIASAKANSLTKASTSEWCPPARYADELFDAYNAAYQKLASCLCSNGATNCGGMMDEYSRNVAAAGRNKARTSKYCI